mmetsp:Transcript_5070/g.15386  ORF Transcript_5070/g.15386 Transcript_5070/m.15386 type:complete len:207 (-) Transcript_5070:553-1173(-)
MTGSRRSAGWRRAAPCHCHRSRHAHRPCRHATRVRRQSRAARPPPRQPLCGSKPAPRAAARPLRRAQRGRRRAGSGAGPAAANAAAPGAEGSRPEGPASRRGWSAKQRTTQQHQRIQRLRRCWHQFQLPRSAALLALLARCRRLCHHRRHHRRQRCCRRRACRTNLAVYGTRKRTWLPAGSPQRGKTRGGQTLLGASGHGFHSPAR